jgi:DNA-directed RNA polymerase subunit RPC12/RpoP
VTQLLARIMLALLMLPLASLVYMLTIIAVDGFRLFRGWRGEMEFLLTGLVTGLFVAIYWVLLWLRTVRWTSGRVLGTLAFFFAAIVPSIALGMWMATFDDELGVFVGTVGTILLWLVATVFVWRETAAERAARFGTGTDGSSVIACPRCGYNLTGLASTQCPECGSRFTLDELLALRRVDDEIEA